MIGHLKRFLDQKGEIWNTQIFGYLPRWGEGCGREGGIRTVPYRTVHTDQAPVVQKVDNGIHQINHYPLDSAIDFAIIYLLDSDLTGG